MTAFLNFLADDRYGWWWLFVAVPCVVFSWAWTAHSRGRQLEGWDLSASPTVPSMMSHVVLVALSLGVVPLALFAALHPFSEYMTWPQFGVNFGCWLVGASVGITSGVLGARAGAERELAKYPSTALRRQ